MNGFALLRPRVSGLAALWLLVAAAGASAQDRFVFGAWPTSASVLPTDPAWRFLELDRTGDGASDLMIFRLSAFHPLYFADNTGSGFQITGGLEDSLVPVDEHVGDFNGDGLLDFLLYDPATGTFYVDLGGTFTRTVWANTGATSSWQIAVGDYSGDGRDDVMLYYPATGVIWIGRSLGASFAFAPAGPVSPAAGWLFVAGRFTGATADEIVGYHPSNDTLWLVFFAPQATQFSSYLWGATTPYKVTQLQAGDFNQDGRTDVLGYDAASPGLDLVVGLSSGSGSSVARWGSAPGPGTWRFTAGRFLGDAQADVVGYNAATGTFSMGHNVQTQCSNGFDDDGDGKTDWDGGDGGTPDPQCAGNPLRKSEKGCGLGAELALLLPFLRRRRRPGARCSRSL
jgi:hypothetical protein